MISGVSTSTKIALSTTTIPPDSDVVHGAHNISLPVWHRTIVGVDYFLSMFILYNSKYSGGVQQASLAGGDHRRL